MYEGLCFHFVRHAPIQPWVKDRAYGARAPVDLSDAQALAKTAISLPTPDTALWAASGYIRAIETAHALLENKAGMASLHILPEFNEQCWGDFADRRHESLAEFPETQAYAIDPINTKPPAGENIHELLQRVARGINIMTQRAREKNTADIVIVSHQWVIAAAEVLRDGVCPLKPSRFEENPAAPLDIRRIRFSVPFEKNGGSSRFKPSSKPLQKRGEPAFVRF